MRRIWVLRIDPKNGNEITGRGRGSGRARRSGLLSP
nr:MAG TPA: hypothetical protein [Caudoviricetes sp.]